MSDNDCEECKKKEAFYSSNKNLTLILLFIIACIVGYLIYHFNKFHKGNSIQTISASASAE